MASVLFRVFKCMLLVTLTSKILHETNSPNYTSRKIKENCTLVPEAFFYSLLANFATRIASYIIFFYWHEALRAEKRKPLVATVGNLTFMPSAFDRRFWLEDIFNCSMSHMIGWIKYLWGWEWSVYVHLYGYMWRTFALSTDSLTREG